MADESDTEAPEELFEKARANVEEARSMAREVSDVYEDFSDEAGSPRELYERNPYAVLAAAAGTGYVLGGGLFTPFTKRVLNIGMKALVLPIAASKLKELTQAAPGDELAPPTDDE